MKYACNLIIDSCCDLPYEKVNKEGIQIVKYPYHMDGKEFEDDLWRTAKPKDFYHRMRKGSEPETSVSTLLALTTAFTAAAIEGTPTVFLSFSAALSASFERTCTIADQIRKNYPDFELYVVDTRLASMGEALLVFEAIRQQEAGMSAKELADWAEEARNYVNVYFMADGLKHLQHGGRFAANPASSIFKKGAKPILYLTSDGTIAMKSSTRNRTDGLNMLRDIYLSRAEISNSQPYVCIGHSDTQKDMVKLEKLIDKSVEHAHKTGEITPATTREPIFIESELGPVIGSHVGPDAVVIAFWGPDKRKDISVADRIARQVRTAV